MIIRKYGLVLSRLKEGDIELVRQMRNTEDIRRYMHYRQEITPEMQKKWFASINNGNNYYFIIEHDGKKIGMIHGRDNDVEKGTCEGGIFIWDIAYIGTFIPAMASVILNDFTFITFRALNTVYAKVVEGNTKAIEYNKLMGYAPCTPVNNDKEVVWMQCTATSYIKHVKILRQGIAKITGDNTPLKVEEIDFSDDTQQDIDHLYKHLPSVLQGLTARIKLSGHQI